MIKEYIESLTALEVKTGMLIRYKGTQIRVDRVQDNDTQVVIEGRSVILTLGASEHVTKVTYE